MIDLAATAVLIQNLKNNGFTSAREKLIAIVLANVSQIQQCEIIEILDLSDPHCRSILKEFVEKKLLESFGKRDIFYRPTGLLEPPAGTVQPLSSFSPFCGESVVNMLTSVNSTNETNKEDSEISFGAQASVSPGVAGQHAIEAELIPPASAVPADSPRSAGGAAKTAEMPPKIDADAFGRIDEH